MAYAIVKTGGKQYRVEEGQTLLVERLRADAGDSVDLETPVTVGDDLPDGGAVSAEIVGHERGPKLRVVKFKPKRGYKRRNGHRQELTRLEVVGINLSGGSRRSKASSAAGAETEAPTPVAAGAPKTEAAAPEPRAARKPRAKAPAEK